MDCDIESFCLALQKITKIKSIKPFINASTFQKDEIGQALIPEDVQFKGTVC